MEEAAARPAKASQVCKSCKDRKRKCDKALPKCSLCARKNLRCDYRYNRTQSAALLSPTSPAAPEATGTDTGGTLSRPPLNDNPTAAIPPLTLSTILFLDPTLLQHGPLQLELYQHGTHIPTDLLNILGGPEEIRLMTNEFFTTVHLWMPIISNQRFRDVCLRYDFQTRPDAVLLLLAMRLVVKTPVQDPRLGDYDRVKRFHQRVEESAALSVRVLQANIFIALYELGHGLYPSAYMTIGACARYMYALGINGTSSRNVNMNPPRPMSLVDIEERRRAWWAVVILDRFVSIASPTRPFASPDPELDDLLPVDDGDWDNGNVNPSNLCTIATPRTTHMSRFSLLCQAARVLGKVICFLNRSGPRNGPGNRPGPASSTGNAERDSLDEEEERIQLDTTLHAMLTAAMQVDEPDLDTITFIYSTMMALYTPSLSSATSIATATTTPQSQPPFDAATRASALIAEVTNARLANMLDRTCLSGRDPGGMSPWRVYFAYRALGVHMRTLREVGKGPENSWIYLRLIEAQEVLAAGA
ncbi:hypothetical protein BJY00DRAFT_325886 [Aspergillus carlsbadensis]|nr:hypothetical protein BJY00DRAFT_325886 [Aspergillus carlsbadensis]